MKNSEHMRIGVNTLFMVPGDVGGTEIYLRQMLKAMLRVDSKICIILFTNKENHKLFQDELGVFTNVEFIRLKFRASLRPLRIIVEQVILPLVVLKHQLDVLWSPGYTAPFWCACPQVVTIHDLQYKRHPEDMNLLERLTLDILVRIACKVCVNIVTVSEFSRQEVIKYGFGAKQKVHAVLEGVESFFGKPEAPERTDHILAECGLSETPYILCVAHSYPHKNIDLLVQAFRKIKNDIPHSLVLIGKARLGEEKLTNEIVLLNDDKRVYRTGGVSLNTLRLLYQKADMFVLPSSYEGFGLPVLEAMMAGVPVIIGNCASLPEVGGQTAIYVDPLTVENLVSSIMGCSEMSEDTREQLTRDGKKWAKEFTWDKSARETLSVLRQSVTEDILPGPC